MHRRCWWSDMDLMVCAETRDPGGERNEEKARPLPEPMIFIGQREQTGQELQRVCLPRCVLQLASCCRTILKADWKLSCMYKPEKERVSFTEMALFIIFWKQFKAGLSLRNTPPSQPRLCIPTLLPFLISHRDIFHNWDDSDTRGITVN